MGARLIVFGMITVLAGASIAAADTSSIQAMATMVAGIRLGGHVIVGGVPITSGAWGTDYVTVSHALAVGRRYTVIQGDGSPADATAVMACSSMAHGIDVLVLRVKTHANRLVMEWGDPTELRAGDELMILPRKEFSRDPVKVKFLHLNLLEWSRTTANDWELQWHNVMVGDGMVRPGFSGSPWARGGKVFGLVKGTIKPPGHNIWYAAAETATRVRQCLKGQHYDELVPQE
jgi:uncharacterized membrane protein